MRPRTWFVLAGLLAVAGLVVGGTAVALGDLSPRRYVANHYSRVPAEDIGTDAVAYRSSRQPDQVAADVTGRWQPAAKYVDGSGVYLRYAEDTVVILPFAAGSLILVERLTTAYARYYGHVGGYWGWPNRGADFRNGGPGSGK
ncbi:MAG TPA: DUF4247 domain-containing protein [Micromonosporaceae bacterium]|nr:DUF4247 domain-containing protein [Micromonosporaceae bacterium]